MLTYLSKFTQITTFVSSMVQAIVFQPNSPQADHLMVQIRHVPSRVDPNLHSSSALLNILSGDITYNPNSLIDLVVHTFNSTIQALNIPQYVMLPQYQLGVEGGEFVHTCKMQTINLHTTFPSTLLRLSFDMSRFVDFNAYLIYMHIFVQCTGTVQLSL